MKVKNCMKKQIICLEGNGSRPSHKGAGYKESDVMYTLNSTEVHGVCYCLWRHIQKNDSSNGTKMTNP